MPKGTRKVHFSFDETHLTHFGGMCLIQRFCNQLRLRWLIQKHVKVPSRNAIYHPSELILALIYAIIMGLRRINKTEILQYNGAFLEMLGLTGFPDQSTLRRFLKRLPPKAIRQLVRLHDSLRAYLFALPTARTTLVFDLDSVVIVIYGKPEGVRVGYNPKKPGRRSYHPLLCFEAHFQEFWHGSLRSGNTVAATGAIPFLKVCLAKVPKGLAPSRIRFRMDSGFYGSRVIRFLDGTGYGYVIVAKKYPHLMIRARAVRFKRLCLPPAYLHATLDTIRTDFLVLPARLIREHKRNIVKLPHDYHYQREFLQASGRISKLRLAKKFRFCK